MGARKETEMDQLQLAMMVMATNESPWAPRHTDGRSRDLTAEELDALVEFGWLVPDFKGVLTACALALRWRWTLAPGRPVKSGDIAGSDSPSAHGASPA